MNEVRLDPQQAPAHTELLLAADFRREARGRPIYGRLQSDDDGADDESGPRLKFGTVCGSVLSDSTDRPSGSVYGNPLGGTQNTAPAVPIRAPVIVRTDIPATSMADDTRKVGSQQGTTDRNHRPSREARVVLRRQVPAPRVAKSLAPALAPK